MRLLQPYLLFLMLVLPVAAGAAGPAQSDAQLVSLFAKLKAADGYTYQVTITSQIEGVPKDQDTRHMTSYQSQSALIIYTKGDDGLSFLCEQGQFRVNAGDKTVYYALFPADTASRNANRARLTGQIASGTLDSLLLSGATVSSKKTLKNIVSYRLGYAPGYFITGLSLSYDLQKNIFVSIGYEVERPIAGSGSLKDGKPSVMRQKLAMDHYEKRIPPEVNSLLAAMSDLKGYLEKTYQGYEIKKINL